MKKFFIIALLCTAAAYTGCTPPNNYISDASRRRISSVKTVNVLVLSSGSQVEFAAERGITVFSDDRLFFTGSSIKLSPDDASVKMKIVSRSSMIKVNGKGYRGLILLYKESGVLKVVNQVNIEDYLCGVVPSEMSKTWPVEALKAQAIAARSYAYQHIASGKNGIYDLDATTSFQVYGGYDAEGPVSNEAVLKTAGVVMISDGKPIAAFFHSTCGGETISNQYVWKGEKIRYLNDEKCTYCTDSPYFNWNEQLSVNDFRAALLKKNPSAGSMKGITFKKHNGRIIECTISHSKGITVLSGNDLRLYLGARKIKSLYFTASKTNNGISIRGHGYGHGVGMCQYGARGMAMQGLDHVEILRKYYRGIEFLRL